MLEKKSRISAITVRESGHIEVQREDGIYDDGELVGSPSYHRHTFSPGDSLGDFDEDGANAWLNSPQIEIIATAVWTPESVKAWDETFAAQVAQSRLERAAQLAEMDAMSLKVSQDSEALKLQVVAANEERERLKVEIESVVVAVNALKQNLETLRANAAPLVAVIVGS